MLAVASVHFCADSTADEVKVKTVNTDSADSLSVDGTVPFVDLNNKILFQLIASEIALQRQEAGAAYRTYLNLLTPKKNSKKRQLFGSSWLPTIGEPKKRISNLF